VATLGCKVNQYETQYVKETLEANGYREAAQEEQADLCVVNTCTVTMEGDAKSRQLIRRLHLENPVAAIAVMGCYATRDPVSVSRLPGVTQVITDKTRLADALKPFGIERMPRGIRRFDGHQRAFVKVQDGCVLNCTFCIIPKVRPGLRSRSAAEIVDEVAGLVSTGRREIVLTGIHLGHYGIDLCKGRPKSQWCRLWHLIQQLDRLDGDFRIRLSSLEAAEARDDLVNAIACSRRVVPHLHLCLQSGSDRILERMGRRYRQAGFVERCLRIREVLGQPSISTDVIVGFPGESDADFEATCDVARKVGFSKIHVFSWSPRKGTPAASLDGRLPPAVIKQRRQFLETLGNQLAEQYQRKLIGQRLDVLVEGSNPRWKGHVMGTSCRYVPVSFEGHLPALLGRRVPVRAVEIVGDDLIGQPEPEPGSEQLPTLQKSMETRQSLPLVNN
jgi:threonylcarbamoyladenosine tRNA methylthiotransferase MtaB